MQHGPAIPVTENIPGLDDDPEGARVVREELRLLTIVTRALASAAEASNAAKGRLSDDARLLELREEAATAKPEDLPALFEQMHHLGALRSQRGKSVTGTIDRGSPYFGHLRLEELFHGESAPRRRDVLIGGRSYVDASAGVRIVDWRHAPVSRVFYRYREGDDYEEILGDRPVAGVVLARRSVAIVGGSLRRVAAPEGTFVLGADGQWKRVEALRAKLSVVRQGEARLGVGADGRARADKLLPEIAAMLDPAQFALITKPGAGLVAIQGSAGSGKTTVGLHRVAYLHATDPRKFRADRMLVVVPSEALIHYTSRVLPDLGVSGVPVTTFSRWATRVVMHLFPRLPSRASDETPPVVARAKTSVRMLGAIDALAASVDRDVDALLRVTIAKWPEGDRVVTAWEKTYGAPDERVTHLSAWLAGKREIKGCESATTLPDVTKGALTELGQAMRKKTRSVLDLWDELLTSRARLDATFAPSANGANQSDTHGLGPGQLAQVHAWCVERARTRAEGERDGEAASIDVEDRALLLRLFQKIRGPLVDSSGALMRTAHLFVDEVQDGSPIELAVLLDVTGPERSVTLAGDVAQRMLDDDDERGEFNWTELLDALGVPRTDDGTMDPLQVSYRSTREITTFAREVLGPFAHDAEPIATRSGPPVELFSFASPGEAVAFLADALKDLYRADPHANVALIARFLPQVEVYYDGLSRAEVPNVRKVTRQDFTWEAGTDVTDVRQTKGLEFDEVILVDTNRASYPDTPQARHALYVGATRAVHQLWCVASEAASPLVTASLESMRAKAEAVSTA